MRWIMVAASFGSLKPLHWHDLFDGVKFRICGDDCSIFLDANRNYKRVCIGDSIVRFDMRGGKDGWLIRRQNLDRKLLDERQGILCFDKSTSSFRNIEYFS